MLGRLTKARITKDVRYQEFREVTLGCGLTTNIQGSLLFLQFTQNKSHAHPLPSLPCGRIFLFPLAFAYKSML